MRYYKLIEGGYITVIGTGGGGTEINEQEYNTIKTIIKAKPPETATTDFRLKADLTWEEFPRIPPDPEPEPDYNDMTLTEAAEALLNMGLVTIPAEPEPDFFNESEEEPDFFA